MVRLENYNDLPYVHSICDHVGINYLVCQINSNVFNSAKSIECLEKIKLNWTYQQKTDRMLNNGWYQQRNGVPIDELIQ